MDIQLGSFRGEAPRLTARELPENGAQEATNCRLQSGDLESWRHFAFEAALANATEVKTIFKLRGSWLSWTSQVDVARGLIPGDTTDRIYLTAPNLYGTPRWTNYALATTGSQPFPVTTRPLGVPNPLTAPTLVVGVAATADIDVTDAGDQGTSWRASGTVTVGNTVSEAVQDGAVGNPAPSYRLTIANNTGAQAAFLRDFGVADSQAITFTSEFKVYSNGSTLQAEFRLANDSTGNGVHVGIGYVTGAAGPLYLTLGVSQGIGANQQPSYLEQIAIAALDGTGATVYRMEMSLTRQANGDSAVVANLYSGATLLGTVDLTQRFVVGGWCGFSGITTFTPSMVTRYDNIRVRGSGTFDLVTIGTNYVYTYVNDIGEESGPSPVSATILRPDGASVTVTTPTAQPAGGYVVTDKRIYRAVTGSGGSIYLRVASIPLATATYVDILDDASIGPQVLETEDSDLPPALLEGIIALPNGIMCGFFANQLCFSEIARPHSWPIKYRLTATHKIVAIANIDNTVVIGTKGPVQTATGTSPGSYTMSKPGEPQACVSKQSMTYVDDVGVVFASPDGMQVCRGSAGNVTNATAGIYNKRQWQALYPSSMIAAVHDGVLHLFYEVPTQNEALWDPAARYPVSSPSIVLSGDRRTASNPAGGYLGQAVSAPNVSHNSGKWYLEFIITDALLGVGNYKPAVGLARINFNPLGDFGEPRDQVYVYSSNLAGIDYTGGNPGVSGTTGGGGTAFADGDRVGIAVDLDAMHFWASVNGVWQFSGNPVADLNPRGTTLFAGSSWVPFFFSQSLGGVAQVVTLLEDFAYEVPSGFQAWAVTAVQGFGRALDVKPDGFGLIRLSYHASAAFTDVEQDALFLVLDEFNEPTDAALPIPPTFVLPGGAATRIYEFDADNTSNLTYRWRGKLNLLAKQTAMQFAKVRAASYANLVASFIGDGVVKLKRAMTSLREFRLPTAGKVEDQYEVEFIGTSTVRTAQVAEDVEELA